VVLIDVFAHSCRQTIADIIRCSVERIDIEVGVTLGGARLCMAKELADDRQAKTGSRPKARVSVP